ncbi:acylneuraminate cytidylyltransferase family protein [Gammaproteobacteria bacterium]|nr:acylneuraminate cytidylyltransferase family protein [Gammaproteobacteria bacterium]
MLNVAIIPARSGSKGIPRKNIKIIAGKPLIAWSIELALKASCIDRVIVSTDSPEIAEVAILYGAEAPFLRPQKLSDDNATTESAILHSLEWLEENENYIPDNIVLLQATSPVRSDKSIDRAFKIFFDNEADSLLSVCQFWHFLWQAKNNKATHALYDFKNRPRRQDISSKEIKFKENGSIYITKSELFKKNRNRLCGKICTFLMSEEESFEIDTHLDWSINETILMKRLDDNLC